MFFLFTEIRLIIICLLPRTQTFVGFCHFTKIKVAVVLCPVPFYYMSASRLPSIEHKHSQLAISD